MKIPFISKFLAQRRTAALKYDRYESRWATRTASGIFITPDNSLRDSTVWACHRYLTQTTGQLNFIIMHLRKDGTAERYNQGSVIHTVDYVLNWRPNPELSPFQFKETLTGWALMYGNGYAEIEFDGAGRVINLWLLEPWRVKVMRDESGTLFYRVDNAIDLNASSVFHIRGFGNGPVGLSLIDYAAQTIGWARATELFGSTYFGEGMNFGGVVRLKGRGDLASMERMKDELENKHKGVGRSNKWVMLDNDAEIEKISAAPNEAQFVETLQFQVEQICRWFGVPPQKVQHLLRATFSNVEQLSIDVIGDAIAPWAIRFEEEATFKLFGLNRQNLFVKMDIKNLLRGDFLTRQTGLQIMRRNGIINSNDWADLEGLPRVTTGGEKYIVEGNMTTLDKIGEMTMTPSTNETPNETPNPTSNLNLPSSHGTQKLLQMHNKESVLV